MDQEVEVVLVVVNHVQSLVAEVAVEVVALNQRVNHAVDPNRDPNHQDQTNSTHQCVTKFNSLMKIDVDKLLKTK